MRRPLVIEPGTILAALVFGGACSPASKVPACGPEAGTVARVIDGDTLDLESGDRVRYLLVDAPEISGDVECWGPEAKAANQALVGGKIISLSYDEECFDAYGRLLAYVRLEGRLINEVLVERGYGCVLYIPPSGSERLEELRAAERFAREHRYGLWSVCADHPC